MILHDSVSRAEVYSAIAKYHRELLGTPTPPESPGTPLPKTSARGRKGGPKPKPGTSNRTHNEAELRFLFERLLVAFHPNSLPLLPCAEWILYYYPPNPAFFRSPETLKEDTRDSDADRVSRVVSHNAARVAQLRQTFSELMGQMMQRKNRTRLAAIVADMEQLGVEWGISEGRIQTVTVWFQGRWGIYGASL